MPFDLSALRVLIKKIFPPEKSILTVDTTGDGKVDSVQIRAFNVVMPFVMPEEIALRDIGMKDFNGRSFNLSEYGRIMLDGESINISNEIITPESLQKRFTVYHKGECFTFDDIMVGKFGGRTVGLGDTINFLAKLEDEDLARFTLGKHSLIIDADNIFQLEIIFELNEDNTNLRFDPNN